MTPGGDSRGAATDIDETPVGRFVSGLPRRPSSTHPRGRPSEVPAASVCWLHTRGHGKWQRAAGRPAARCEADQWLERFDDHLVHVHGPVVGTRQIYGRYAAALLAECAGTPTPDRSRLTVPAIAAFVQTRANRPGPSARRSPVSATRAFLRSHREPLQVARVDLIVSGSQLAPLYDAGGPKPPARVVDPFAATASRSRLRSSI